MHNSVMLQAGQPSHSSTKESKWKSCPKWLALKFSTTSLNALRLTARTCIMNRICRTLTFVSAFLRASKSIRQRLPLPPANLLVLSKSVPCPNLLLPLSATHSREVAHIKIKRTFSFSTWAVELLISLCCLSALSPLMKNSRKEPHNHS